MIVIQKKKKKQSMRWENVASVTMNALQMRTAMHYANKIMQFGKELSPN